MRITDIPNPDHHQYAEFQQLKQKITFALNRKDSIRDFNRRYIPTTAPCPQTLAKLTTLLAPRRKIETSLEHLLDAQLSVEIEPQYEILIAQTHATGLRPV